MLRFLLEKEFKQLFRNKFLPRLIVLFPLISLAVFPLVADFEVRNLNLSVINNDMSPYSRRLMDKVASSGYFRVTDVSSTYGEALTAVELDRADVILEIPPGFERDLVRERTASVLVAANAVNATKGGLGSAYLAGIVADFGGEIRAEFVQGNAQLNAPLLDVVALYRYNPHLIYRIFMVPALMVMMLTMVCGFLPALNIVGEKERGTIEQMNVTPVRKLTFILSKLIPYWVVGFTVLTICFGVAWLLHGLLPKGSLLTIYLFAAVFVAAMSGLGLVISNYARTVHQAMFMMFFFVVSLIFLSGLYTPVKSMPDWAQTLSIFSPLKYLMLVMRHVYLKGSAFAELTEPFFALCCFAVALNGWAVYSYRKRS